MAHTAKLSTGQLDFRFPLPEVIPESGALWVIVCRNEVAVTNGEQPTIFCAEKPAGMPGSSERVQYLGHRNATPCYAVESVAGTALPAGWQYSGVRDLFGRVPDAELAIAALAVQLMDFDRTTLFCGRCGAKTRQLRTERAKFCSDCNLITYPRLSPAIIVLVGKDDEVLLARSPHFPAGLHSTIAGFVEPGENLEHAVSREVFEEVGITVKNIRYFGSEPWPFPHSFMIGFVADYAGGEIMIDNKEIVSAGWFSRDTLPLIPSPLSISRALIDSWVARRPPIV
ncbi:MAG: NAD(+) diphosphatase [Methanoregula sp.]|nr:NAD(+) diphosphatase [Methanoregula sp.]